MIKKYLIIGLMSTLLLSACSTTTSESEGVLDVETESSQATQPEYMDVLFNKDEIIEIEIRLEEDKWNDMIENALAEQYVEADIVINGELVSSVGIRPKGNSSLTSVASDSTTDRFSFKIDFAEYVKGQRYYGLKKFVLNNNIGDATYMKEYMSYELMNAMGIATPGYAYANISVNGEPWGLYLAVEVMEDDFVSRQFNSTEGNLYKPESMDLGNGNKQLNKEMNINPFTQDENTLQEQLPIPEMSNQTEMEEIPESIDTPLADIAEQNQLPPVPVQPDQLPIPDQEMFDKGNKLPFRGSSGGSNLVYIDDNIESYSSIFDNIETKNTGETDQLVLIDILKQLNEGTDLESCLDIEEILRYFAVNTFLVNLDSYAGSMKHNYYLYEENGMLQILPWDMNLSFGTFQMNEASKVINFPIDQPVTDTMENSPLISKLLEVTEYKEMYHQYLNELIEKYMDSGYFENTVNKVHELISPFVKNDATAFYTYDEYVAGYKALLVYATDRTISIKAQLSGEQPSETYGTIETQLNLNDLGTQNMGGKNQMNRFDPNQNNFQPNQLPFGQKSNATTE